LDEFWSHKFLESFGETLTVVQLREKLRQIDLDSNGKMALLEYLCFRFSKSVVQVVDAPQGDNTEELMQATAKLQAVQDAMAAVQKQLEEQKLALENQKQKAEEAKKGCGKSIRGRRSGEKGRSRSKSSR